MAISMTLEQVEMLVKKAGLSITDKSRNGNNLATTLRLANGCLVHCWDTGRCFASGSWGMMCSPSAAAAIPP